MSVLVPNFNLLVDTFTKDLICSVEGLGLIPSVFVCIPGCAVWDIMLMTLALSGHSSVPPKSGSDSTLCALVQDSPKRLAGESSCQTGSLQLSCICELRGAGRARATSFKYFTDWDQGLGSVGSQRSSQTPAGYSPCCSANSLCQ